MRHRGVGHELQLDLDRWRDATSTRAAAFEAAIAERTSARHVIAVASPAMGFQIAFRAAGVPIGATVLTTSLADPSVARATVGSGLQPRFVDIDPHGHLGVAAVRAHVALHGEPAVLVPSCFAGHPSDIDAVAAEAPHALLVEDATDALGAVRPDGRAVGSPNPATIAVLGIPAVRAAPAQGAVLVTDDDLLADRVRHLRDERDEHRLSELHAALGLVQVGRLAEVVALRESVAARYDAVVAGLALAEPVPPPANARSAWTAYPLRLPAWLRPAVLEPLRAWGIGGHRLVMLLHRHPYLGRYADVLPAALPATERFASEVVLLPTGAVSGDAEVTRVAGLLASTVGGGADRAHRLG